jgi:hypothetical protein
VLDKSSFLYLGSRKGHILSTVGGAPRSVWRFERDLCVWHLVQETFFLVMCGYFRKLHLVALHAYAWSVLIQKNSAVF